MVNRSLISKRSYRDKVRSRERSISTLTVRIESGNRDASVMVEKLSADPGITDSGTVLTEATGGTSVHNHIRMELSDGDKRRNGSCVSIR